MRRLIVTLDNTLDDWLHGEPNQAEIVRKALRLYHGDITTDTREGLRIVCGNILARMEKLEGRFVEQYEMVEQLLKTIEELKNR